jgi:transposase
MKARERWRPGLRLSKAQHLEVFNAWRKAEKAGDHRFARRLCAIRLVGQQSLTQESAAAVLGVTENAVTRWVMAYKRCGVAGLRTRKAPGAKPRLSPGQLIRLRRMIVDGPEACGFDTGVWDGPTVRELIRRKFRVTYAASHVRAILHNLRLSVKRPKRVAPGASAKAKRHWLTKELPGIKREAKRDRGVVAAEDEASFKVSGTVHQTWGPTGEDVIIKSKPGRTSCRVFGLTTLDPNTPLFRFRFEPGQFNGATFIRFLDQSTRYFHRRGKRLHLILDGAPWHTAAKKWAEAHSKWIKLHFLPPYSPELNPQEPLWQMTKKKATHNRFFDGRGPLHDALKRRFVRYQANPAALRGLISPWV